MKFTSFFIITFLLICFLGCEKKDNKEQNVTKTEQTTVITEDYSRNFALNLDNGQKLNMKKIGDGFNIDENNSTAHLFVFLKTWSQPCKAQIKILNSINKTFGSKLSIVGVLLEDKKIEEVKDYMKQNSISYNIAYGEENGFFSKAIGEVNGVPFMSLYDTKGKLLTSYKGLVIEEILENDLERLL